MLGDEGSGAWIGREALRHCLWEGERAELSPFHAAVLEKLGIESTQDIIARDPKIVHYPMADGSIKLAAGWLIDACGWKGKSVGKAGVYDKQALVLVNRGTPDDSVTGGEVMTLARAIQTSVYERFGIRLEPEPVVL